jgi:hypothetical protein
MELTPPPYTRKHLKKFSEFLKPTFPNDNGDGFTAAVQKLADARDQAAEGLPAIRQRIDALRDAIDKGWCAPRGIENQINHLHRSLSPYHLSRYLKDALATLDEAEADWRTWQQMTATQRDERWVEWGRAEDAADERRKKQVEISKRQDAFYSAFFAMGISPIPMEALSEARLSESGQKLCDAELEISNMGNHLYE